MTLPDGEPREHAQGFEGQALLEALLVASPDGVVVVDDAGVVVLASSGVAELFGYDAVDLVGEPIERLLPDDLADDHRARRAAFADAPRPRPMGLGLDLVGRRRDGARVQVDVSLAPFEMDGRRLVGAFVRDAGDRRRYESGLSAINEITRQLLAGQDAEATLSLIAGLARRLTDAALGWVVTPGNGPGLVIIAGDGDGATAATGTVISDETSLSAQAMAKNAPVIVDNLSAEPVAPDAVRDLGLGPAVFVPLDSGKSVLGALAVGRRAGAAPFEPALVELLQVFASAAAVALGLGETRRELERLQVTEEHDRIARDLHDTVIQRLFALGMALESVHQLANGPVAERIEQVVDGLDEVIREIRETIFHLQRPSLASSGLRVEVVRVVALAEAQLGFAPRVGFFGPVDALTSEELTSTIAAVVSEALSNVARHAGATSVQVVIEADARELVVSVADDGAGPPAGPTAGNGLRNLADRAAQLGGSTSLVAREPAGAVLEWRVPID